ncbi:MAG TPA: thioredoxin [Corynebacteriales bacterium]|nr:thioredoxin [Mycobacteriales bacterium]
MSKPVTVTSDNFREAVVESDKPVLVDFWAAWCGPCQMVGPVLDEIAKEQADKLTVAKVNVDEQQALAQLFGVMSIPTMMLFKDGKVAKTMTGARPKAAIMKAIEDSI